MFNCTKDGTQLIWGNDFDAEDYGYEFEGIVGSYTCPMCDTMYQIVDNFDVDEQFIIMEQDLEY